jgi:hypothetical protein
MIRRQARFLGKPVHRLDMETGPQFPENASKAGKFLKHLHEHADDSGSTDAKRLELAMQRRALHAYELRRARDIAREAADLGN